MQYRICRSMMILRHCYLVLVSSISFIALSSSPLVIFDYKLLNLQPVHIYTCFFYRYKLFLLCQNCGNFEGNGSRHEKFIWTLWLTENEGLARDFTIV